MDTPRAAALVLVIGLIHTAHGQCVGGTPLVYTAGDSFTVFTSPNYPSGYHNNLNCQWRIEADNVTDAIRIEITDASIEFHGDCVYDFGEVFDGHNNSADSLGRFCGTMTPSYVSTGNYAFVTFQSDYSMSLRGFKARFKSGDRDSLLDQTEDNADNNMVFILAVAGGGFLLLVIIMVIFITCVQAKKAKRTRRRLRRGHSTRVQPFDNGNVWSTLDVPAPPAYGEVYSSPLSPPPEYSEMDPNPDPAEPLPARAQYMDDRRASRQITHVIQVHRNQGTGSSGQPNLGVQSTREPTNTSDAGSARTSQLSPRTQRGISINLPQNSRAVNNANVESETGGLPNSTDTSVLIGNVAPMATESVQRGANQPTMTQNNSRVTPRNIRMRGAANSNRTNTSTVNQPNTRGTPRGPATRGGRGARSGIASSTPRATASVNTPQDVGGVTNVVPGAARNDISRNGTNRGRGANNSRRNPPRGVSNTGNNNNNIAETNIDQQLNQNTHQNQNVPANVRNLTQPPVVGSAAINEIDAVANERQLPPGELATASNGRGEQRRESDSDVSVVSLPDSDGSVSISASMYDSDNE